MQYTWVPFFKELGRWLGDFEQDQQALVDILQKAGVNAPNDQYPEGHSIPLTEIDPFTFFALLTKHGPERQLAICSQLKTLLNLKAAAPVDVDGVPTSPAQKSWLFQYKYLRQHTDIPLLWKLYHQVQANQVTDEVFGAVRALHGVGVAKLTQSLFYLQPDRYFPINGQTEPYLEAYDLDPKVTSFTQYQTLLSDLEEVTDAPYPVLSYVAWLENRLADDIPTYTPEQLSVSGMAPAYYCVGVDWSGNDQLPSFLERGIWKNGYWDKFLNIVKKVPVGARVAAKAVHTENNAAGVSVTAMKIRALGTVTGNPGDGRTLEVAWDEEFTPFKLVDQGSYWKTISAVKKESLRKAIFGTNQPPLPPVGGGDPPVIPPNAKRQYPNPVPYALNTILYGPPGTGKTYHTLEIAAHIVSGEMPDNHAEAKHLFDELRGNQIEFITFHQSYTYEDFVIGIKPSLLTEGLGFERHEGVFYRVCQRALDNYQNPAQSVRNYVLIIDEINRANISRVFGELITLLEDDKRVGAPNALTVTLPLNTTIGGRAQLEELSVPPNLFILGTMNTADKSIALVDIALRRRFEFKGYYPQYELLGLDFTISSVMKALNKEIYDRKRSADFLIGHAYFLGKTVEELPGILNKKILPLLMEYFGGRNELVKPVIEAALQGTDWMVEDNETTFQLVVKADTKKLVAKTEATAEPNASS